MPSPCSREAYACRSTCGVSLVTGPRRCWDAAWPSAVAKVSPPIGPPRSEGNSTARGSSHSSVNWPRTSWTHQTSSGRASPSIGTSRSLGPEPREPLPIRTWILPSGPCSKMQVLQPKPAQLPQPQPHFSGQPGHRVVASGGQPLTCARQLAAPGREERRQSGGRRRHPDLEVTAVARPVAVIDRGGDHPAGQLADLTPVSGFQEPEKQVDRLGLPPPGPHRLVPLRLAQEPVGVSGLDLPHRHTRLIQELLHRCDLAEESELRRLSATRIGAIVMAAGTRTGLVGCRVRAGLHREENADRQPANTLIAWPQSRPRRSSPPAQRRRWR